MKSFRLSTTLMLLGTLTIGMAEVNADMEKADKAPSQIRTQTQVQERVRTNQMEQSEYMQRVQQMNQHKYTMQSMHQTQSSMNMQSKHMGH